LVNQTLQIMKTRFLFPARAKYLGVVLIALGLLFNYYSNIEGTAPVFVWENFSTAQSLRVEGAEVFDDEIQLSLVLIGLIMIACSKEKIEDEQITQLRLESLQWAVYFNYAVFFVLIFTQYGLGFLAASMYNVLTLLVFFIIRFRWSIYKNNRSMMKEVLA
jgi:hypothetical protein